MTSGGSRLPYFRPTKKTHASSSDRRLSLCSRDRRPCPSARVALKILHHTRNWNCGRSLQKKNSSDSQQERERLKEALKPLVSEQAIAKADSDFPDKPGLFLWKALSGAELVRRLAASLYEDGTVSLVTEAYDKVADTLIGGIDVGGTDKRVESVLDSINFN